MAIPSIKKDDTLDPAYFARRPRSVQSSGTTDLSELIKRLIKLEDCCDEVQPQLKTLSDAITILNGTDNGSVVKIVESEIDKVIDNAPETFDTLKEVADWIENNETTINNLQVVVNQLEAASYGSITNSEIDNLF